MSQGHMSWLRKSKYEKFIEQNADGLVHNLAYYSAASAKDVVNELGNHSPPNLNVDVVFLFLFSLRGTIDALGVRNRFGKRAHKTIIAALDKLYEASFPDAHACTGTFSQSLMQDVQASLNESSNPIDWIRIHSMRTLETKDPQDELFHAALARVFGSGESMLATIEQAS